MTTIQQLRMSDRLPSPKGVALAITELCNQEDVSLPAVVQVLKTDPALTGRLVKLANAAAYSGRPVVALQDAVARIGLGTVKQVSLGFSLMDNHRQGTCRGFDFLEFWSHSLLAAIVMKECGSQTRLGAPDELFALGLLSQIGQLALASVLPEEYGKVLDIRREAPDRPLVEIEEEQLHTNHLAVTGALLEDWGIPTALISPVLHHERPETSPFPANSRPGHLAQLLNLAGHLADLGRAPEAERHRHIPGILLAGGQVGLGAETMAQIVDTAFRDWREWSTLLHVPSSALPTFDVLSQATAPRQEKKGASAPLRVLLVEDDKSQRLLLRQFLTDECGHNVHEAATGKEALALALEVMPQVVLTDWVMPEMDGLELCRALRATEIGRHLYVLMLTGRDDNDHLEEAYEAGVDAYVAKPVNLRALGAGLRAAWRSVRLKEEWDRDREQLQRFATELAAANRRLEKAALTDLVTNLPNRRAAMAFLEQAWAAAVRSNLPLSLMVVDIDDFKKVNDRYGHAVGDVALREVAGAMRATARKEEAVCRLGGEEFLVICPNTDLRGALQTAERLREVVAATRLSSGPHNFGVTISVGVAGKESSMANPEDLVHTADQAMYGAKGSGRNRTFLSLAGKLRGSGT
jgi:diguanylate cyclase (GGDEF)-like protein